MKIAAMGEAHHIGMIPRFTDSGARADRRVVHQLAGG